MALLDSEVQRCKAELGYNVLSVGAEPRIDYVSLFDQVVQPYTLSGATTTCSTTVAASSPASPVSLTLASATGFAVNNVVVVDVDDRQETAVLSGVSGSVISVMLANAHSGTYLVTVEGGESIIRETLSSIAEVKQRIRFASARAGLKRVDEIEFYGTTRGTGSPVIEGLTHLLSFWRDELASILGVPNLWRMKRGGSALVLY